MNTTHKSKIAYVFIIGLILLTVTAASAAFWIFRVTASAKFDKTKLETDSAPVVLDIYGEQIESGTYGIRGVNIEKVPQNLIDAFVVTEDRRFYSHNGIDPKAIVRASIKNIASRRFAEGASTISQQVIKNTHLTSEKTIERKLCEMKMATQMEHELSKNEILEAYFNVIYFGNSIYGVQNCAYFYFGKNYWELDAKECAILAAVVKNPAKYSPQLNLENSLSRANGILSLMYKYQKLSDEEYYSALSEIPTVNVNNQKNTPEDAYIRSALSEAAEILNIGERELKLKNYTILTFMDPDIQSKLISTASNEYYSPENSNGFAPDRMLIIVDNASLGVTGYYASNGLSAYSVKRQLGSLIKPLGVYAPALEMRVIAPCTPIEDKPREFENGYSPKNYSDRYYGTVTARFALENSLNIPAVTIADKIGIETVKNYLSKLGLKTSENDGLALALGGSTKLYDIVETAAAYATFANDGLYDKVSIVSEIRDENGKILYKKSKRKQRVFSSATSFMLTDMLMHTATNGTAKKLCDITFDVAAKTGTVQFGDTESNNDAWSVAYTPDYTLVSWYGNVSGTAEKALDNNLTGGSYPTIILKNIIEKIGNGGVFQVPESVVSLAIDKSALKNGNVEKLPDSTFDICGEQWYFDVENIPKTISIAPLEQALSTVEFENGVIILSKNDHVQWSVTGENVLGCELPLLEFGDKFYCFCPDIDGEITVYATYPDEPEIVCKKSF